jgi:hypothetical protein
MKKAWLACAIVLLLTAQVFCVLPGQGQPTLVPGVTADSPEVTVTSPDTSVGTINLVNSQVQTGQPNNLQYLEGEKDFNNGESVLVTEGGKGKLTLDDGTLMTLFNQTEVSGVNVSTSPRETDLFLQNQGFLGHVPPGGHTTVNMPNGAKVTILGTYFFVVFNSETQVATVGNFDGNVRFIAPGGTEQELPPRQMVDIPAQGQGDVVFWAIPFTPADFEAAVDTYGTPSAGLGGLIQEFGMQPLQFPREEPQPPITVTIPPVPQTGWSGWEQIDGEFQDAPAVASWGSNRLDVFIRALNNELWHQAWDGANWSGWFSLQGVLTSAPAAVSWGENRIDVFALGTDREVWHRTWDGGWLDWISEGGGDVESDGLLDDAPGVTATGSKELYLFVRNSGHNLKFKYWGGESWSAWDFLGGVPIYSSPSVVSRGAGMLDIVARGESGQVLWRNALGDWTPFEVTIQDAPALTSWGPERMDLFVRGTDNSLLHSTWNPATSWSDWENLGGPIYSAPAAVSWGPGRIDVFARGEAGNLIHIWYQE